MTLTSTEGVGSVFSLFMPHLDINGQPLKFDAEVEVRSNSDHSTIEFKAIPDIRCKTPSRILVAEDNLTNKELMRILLEKMGHEVLEAKDGIEAVEKATTDDMDLIFMDMQMPNMNGYEATMALRDKGVSTPIIALTANAMKGDRERCIEAGCNDYLSKPIRQIELRRIVNRYIAVGSIAV